MILEALRVKVSKEGVATGVEEVVEVVKVIKVIKVVSS
jgi:hypothetical protein